MNKKRKNQKTGTPAPLPAETSGTALGPEGRQPAAVNERVKFWLPIAVSLALFGINFVYTFYASRSQNKKWEALNLGRVELVEVASVFPDEQVSRAEIKKIKWGYAPTISFTAGAVDNGRPVFSLVLVSTPAGAPAPGLFQGRTVDELMKQARHQKLPPESFTIKKVAGWNFSIKNTATTPVRELTCRVYRKKIAEGFAEEAPAELAIPELGPNALRVRRVEAALPLHARLFKEVGFLVALEYTDISGQRHKREIPVLWTPADGSFSYGS